MEKIDNYVCINRQLASKNSELQSMIAELQKEIIKLNRNLAEQQEEILDLNHKLENNKNENLKLMDSIKNILCYSYEKVIKEFCAVLPNASCGNSTIPALFVTNSSLSMSRNNITTRVSRRISNSIKQHSMNNVINPLQNVTNSRGNRTRSQSNAIAENEKSLRNSINSLNHSTSYKNQSSIFSDEENGDNEDIDSFVDKTKTERNLKTLNTIVEESLLMNQGKESILNFSNSLTHSSTLITKDSMYAENYTDYLSGINSTNAPKSLSDTTLNHMLNAPSSTPFKKRKHLHVSDLKLNPIVKVYRLKEEDIKRLTQLKPDKISVLKDKNYRTTSISKRKINKTNNVSNEDTTVIKFENSNEHSLRPRRKAAPSCLKESAINTKMRYDPKKIKIDKVRI